MPDKKIKHFIFMRFFSSKKADYPYDIYDVTFLTKQLLLAKNNALSSLENQTNKNFDLVFITNPKFFDNPKYEFVFSALQYATTLPLKFIKVNEMSGLVKNALKEYDFVIYSRMDLDDFIFKNAIADTHSNVAECDNILAYGYCRGYSYIWGELYEHYRLWKGVGHHSVLQSLILKTSFAKNLPILSIYNPHPTIKTFLKKFLDDNGLTFSENMFKQNTSTNAYIYFRHEFSLDQFVEKSHNPLKPPKNKEPITSADITKKQLADEFGFHLKLNSIK